jgi:hypothetical protein
VGSIEVGKWADLVLWKPAFFGVKPAVIMKGGFIAMAAMGDPNASIPTPQPVHYRPMFGAFGGALHRGSLTFVSQAALAGGVGERYGLHKTLSAVKDIRGIGEAPHAAQRLCATHGRRRANLCGARRWRLLRLRTRQCFAHGAALLLVLTDDDYPFNSKLSAMSQGLAPVLLKARDVHHAGLGYVQESRFESTDSGGRQVGVFLQRGQVVRGGDVLVGEDGSPLKVLAAPQAVLRITIAGNTDYAV